jgi:hypothetical protein
MSVNSGCLRRYLCSSGVDSVASVPGANCAWPIEDADSSVGIRRIGVAGRNSAYLACKLGASGCAAAFDAAAVHGIGERHDFRGDEFGDAVTGVGQHEPVGDLGTGIDGLCRFPGQCRIAE